MNRIGLIEAKGIVATGAVAKEIDADVKEIVAIGADAREIDADVKGIVKDVIGIVAIGVNVVATYAIIAGRAAAMQGHAVGAVSGWALAGV